ncbi:PDZ domain-containing protein [Rhodopirellula halodulae]|uniref:PDZ domain-containing protein n=1 Tax=Rhodopirellula halodulae TaxID=2894198 RepID=UPI001E4E1BA5|nr:PDZ domain-containing protein [Rhodopirellula sp. JC737]MCC9654211.1 PDZ domain-containing protein [Rhodopirellula sp. JC737]
MLRSHRRSNWIRWAACLTMVSCIQAMDASDASAQRLLERLRNRMQTPPPSPFQQPPYQNPSDANRPNSERSRILATPLPRRAARNAAADNNRSNDRTRNSNPNQNREAQNSPAIPSQSPRSAESPRLLTSRTIQLGLQVVPTTVGGYRGLEVVGFSPESRADEAGLRRGDVLVSIGNSPTRTLNEAIVALENVPGTAGSTIPLQLFREGRLYSGRMPLVAATQVAAKPPVGDNASGRSVLERFDAPQREQPRNSVGSTTELPAPSPSVAPPVDSSGSTPTLARARGSLGIEVRDATPQRGVLVVTVPDGSAGQVSGLKEGDRIVSASGRLIRGTDDLLREVSILQPGDEISVGLIRDEAMVERQIEMGGPNGTPTRSAIARSQSEQSAATSAEPDAAESNSGGFLGGMGSMFGKMLGGNAAAPSTSNNEVLPAPKPDATDSGADLPAPMNQLPAPAASNDVLPDPLELPNDGRPSIEALPPSTPTLPAPQKEAKQPTVEELQREIERLKEQLQAKD